MVPSSAFASFTAGHGAMLVYSELSSHVVAGTWDVLLRAVSFAVAPSGGEYDYGVTFN
jgi:hypothetical protein